MLFRLVFAALLVGIGAYALYAWRRRAALRARTLSSDELSRFRALGARSEPLREALELRDKVHDKVHDKVRAPGAGLDAAAVRDGVEEAVRELAVKVELAERLLRTANDLEDGASEEDLRAAKREVEGAADDDAKALAEERVAVLERQRASAAELRRRHEELIRTNERIVLSLREVHVALLELQASAGAGEGGSGGARDKLQEASAELRRRASAHDEIRAFLEASGQG